jgi:hypothetical protein
VGEAIRRRAERPDAVSGLLDPLLRASAHAESWDSAAGDGRASTQHRGCEFYGRANPRGHSTSIAGEELATVATARGEALDLAGEYEAARALSFAQASRL